MQHDGEVKARRVTRYYDENLRTWVTRVYGYQARCKCGWKGNTFPEYGQAGNELIIHKLDRNNFEHKSVA